MKTSAYLEELKTLSVADLQAQLVDAKKELFNLRFQNATNQLRFAVSGHLTGDRVLRGDVLRLDRLHLHGDAGGRGDHLFLFAARKAQRQRERQQQGNRFLFHRLSPPQPASRP